MRINAFFAIFIRAFTFLVKAVHSMVYHLLNDNQAIASCGINLKNM